MSMGRQSGRRYWWVLVVPGIGLMARVAGKDLVPESQSALQKPADGCSVCLAEHRHCSSPMLHRCTYCSASNKHSQKLDSHRKTDLAPGAQCSCHIFWLIEHEVDLGLRVQREGGTESMRHDQTQTN